MVTTAFFQQGNRDYQTIDQHIARIPLLAASLLISKEFTLSQLNN